MYCIKSQFDNDFKFVFKFLIKYDVIFLHAKPWIPGGDKSISTTVIH